ncbi:MAG: G8 domain-containing protein [Myxococcota bacterium]|jgi:hypothetical protein|nr:G8 domain-containing protein [Myxococcota bacterium]
MLFIVLSKIFERFALRACSIPTVCALLLGGCGEFEVDLDKVGLTQNTQSNTPARSAPRPSTPPQTRQDYRKTAGQRALPTAPSPSPQMDSHHTAGQATGPYGPRVHMSLTQLLNQSSFEDVVVPTNYDVIINQNIKLGFIKVLGTLRCADDFHGEVQTDGILVMGTGAKFSCGTKTNRFTGKAKFILKNNRELSEMVQNAPHMMGGKAVVVMHGGTISMFGETNKSKYTRLDAQLKAGQNAITLAAQVDWAAEDDIVVSTTSFYQDRSEKFGLSRVNPNRTITLDQDAQYDHYGNVQHFDDWQDNESYILDERAYVANLTRNIVFMSAQDEHTANQIGAHMMVMHQGKAYIDGVEFFRVGQMEKMGRYPFHWHQMGDVDGQFIRNSSIHESYHRCVTIHNTHKAHVVNNICYDHYGQ